jgi:hypothetical protein
MNGHHGSSVPFFEEDVERL